VPESGSPSFDRSGGTEIGNIGSERAGFATTRPNAERSSAMAPGPSRIPAALIRKAKFGSRAITRCTSVARTAASRSAFISAQIAAAPLRGTGCPNGQAATSSGRATGTLTPRRSRSVASPIRTSRRQPTRRGRGEASLAGSGDGDRAFSTGSSSDPLTCLSTISNPTSRRPRDRPLVGHGPMETRPQLSRSSGNSEAGFHAAPLSKKSGRCVASTHSSLLSR
jgi:hypothetical protein